MKRAIFVTAALLSLATVGADAGAASQEPPIAAAARGDRSSGWRGQTRSEVLGMNGVVATSQPLAAQAGLKVLQDGGNAFDAAVATAAVINVVEPEATGVGGDIFVIAWSAKDKKLVALNGGGRAPAAMTPAYFKTKGLDRIPSIGIDSAVIPTAVDGWAQLLARYGKMNFEQVLEPAAQIAEQGFGISERIGDEWRSSARNLATDAESARVYLPNGQPPAAYALFRNRDLAKTFRILQKKGRDAFYEGEIAEAIVAQSARLGGAITKADLAATRATWEAPLSTSYHGYDIYEFAPTTPGFAVLEMMNILEVCAPRLNVDIAAEGPRSAKYWHLLVEAKKLAYADLQRYGGDPDFSKVPVERLISKSYAGEQCAKIDPAKASTPASAIVPAGGTAYIAAADKEGNIVSLIYSVYGYFGASVTIPGYGFVLNNRGSQFSLDPNSPNVIAPRKRPLHTIIPGFIMKDGEPLTAFGLLGTDQQAQGHAQVLVNMIDFGANIQAASDAARVNHNQRTNRLQVESQLYEAVGAGLAALGHDAAAAGGAAMGGYQAVMRDPKTGLLHGASDHRKDGAAVGY